MKILMTLVLLAAVSACKRPNQAETKAIVTSDRQNAVAFLPMREYSTTSKLELRAVSCVQDPSLPSGRPEVLMNILEAGVRVDPAALYYRGSMLVTANDSLITIQGYAVSHNCRVQISVPAFGATGFYALFADKRPEFEILRQTIWLALRGPFVESQKDTPTLDAFISEVLQATRTPDKAIQANKILDERYNPCLPKVPGSDFDKLRQFSCLREPGATLANYLSRSDNLPEIREKLTKLATEFAQIKVSAEQLDQVADLFGFNIVVGGSMALRKTGAVARLAALGLDAQSMTKQGFKLQDSDDFWDHSGSNKSGESRVGDLSSLTRGSGAPSELNTDWYQRQSQTVERVLTSSKEKSLSSLLEEYSSKDKTPVFDNSVFGDSFRGKIVAEGTIDPLTAYYQNPKLGDLQEPQWSSPKPQARISVPRPSDLKPESADQLRVNPPQQDFRPSPQGGPGGFSIDPSKVPQFDPAKPGAVTPPKPMTSETPVAPPTSTPDGKTVQGPATYGARCKELGGSMVGTLCVCPQNSSQDARLTVNPEDPSELTCDRKRAYLAQEKNKETPSEDPQKKIYEAKIAKLERACRSFNGTLEVPADRIVKDAGLYCICNNIYAERFYVSSEFQQTKKCLTNDEINKEGIKRQDRIVEKIEDCKRNRNGINYDAVKDQCTCPSGWVWVEDDGRCHWASMAWYYRDAPKETSHYEQENRRPWTDYLNPGKLFTEHLDKQLDQIKPLK